MTMQWCFGTKGFSIFDFGFSIIAMTVQRCLGTVLTIAMGILTVPAVSSADLSRVDERPGSWALRAERPLDANMDSSPHFRWLCAEEALPSYPKLGAAAPEFDLPDLAGKRLRLEDLRGKSVLLNFWAFWCDTWREEMPHLRELSSRQDDLDFRIVAISVDGTRLPEFAPRAASDLPFPVLLDIGGKATSDYRVEHVPTVILLDGEGRVRFSCVAWPGNQVILNQLRKLASMPPAETPPAVTQRATRPKVQSKTRRRTRASRLRTSIEYYPTQVATSIGQRLKSPG